MAKKSYIDRLKISIEGSEDTKFYTKSGTLVAKGYVRVVIGDYELLFNDFFDSLDITFDYLKEIRFIK